MKWRRTGLKSFKNFLNRCSKGPEVEEATAKANRTILKEYLEAQCRNAIKAAEKEAEERETGAEKEEPTAFGDVAQMWGYANQVHTLAPPHCPAPALADRE